MEKNFTVQVLLKDDGSPNMVDRLEEVVRNAVIDEFGNAETISVFVSQVI